MRDQGSIYRDSGVGVSAALLGLGAAVVGASLYLVNYYFEAKYPTGLQGGSICDMGGFLNCDVTTWSPASNVLGVPLSLFGLLLGALLLAGFVVGNPRFERALHVFLAANLAGCLGLLVYSLGVLRSLCPFCALYYVLSLLAFLLFHWKLPAKDLEPVPVAVVGSLFLALFGVGHLYVGSKEERVARMRTELVAQYDALPELGEPPLSPPYRLSPPPDEDGPPPVRIVKFSDFECPSCKVMSGTLAKVVRRYGGRVDVRYSFYPLDQSCNPSMRGPLHRNACLASYLAWCLPGKFPEIEHRVFANQEGLTREWLEGVAEEEGAAECVASPAAREAVTEMVRAAEPFNVRSTPTLLVNGRKIEGVLPLNQLTLIIDELLARRGP